MNPDEITSLKPPFNAWQLIRTLRVLGFVALLLFGSRAAWRSGSEVTVSPSTVDLKTARSGFSTQLLPGGSEKFLAAPEPREPFHLIRYPSAVGALSGYISADPGDGRRHAAVLWAHSRFGGIANDLFEEGDGPRAFFEAGFVVFCPSFRGENDNPGRFEMFYGEVDDLLAARDHLATQPYVDPERIYLVGLGPGGTLVLLATTATDRFRAAFSVEGAPDIGRVVADGQGYGNTPFDINVGKEAYLRSAIRFTQFIKRPTFYFGGGESFYRWDARKMKIQAVEQGVPFDAFFVEGVKLENTLAPLVQLLAKKLEQDTGPLCNLSFTAEEVAHLPTQPASKSAAGSGG